MVRARPPNPLTGPFYVEGAEPGDALVVRFRQSADESQLGIDARIGSGLYSLTPESIEGLYPNRYKPNEIIKERVNVVPWDLDLKRQTVRLREPSSAVHKMEFAGQADARLCRRGAGGRLRAHLVAVRQLRRQSRLQRDRRGHDRHPAGVSSWRAAVHRRRPRAAGRRRADRHRHRDVDGRRVHRRACGRSEPDRTARRNARAHHQHRQPARVRQLDQSRAADGHERHGQLADVRVQDGAVGGASADRLPGPVRRRDGRRLGGAEDSQETAARNKHVS